MRSISFEDAKKRLHEFIDEMDGMDMERLLAQEFYVKGVWHNTDADEIEFEPTDGYNGELG